MGEIIRPGEEEPKVINQYETIPHDTFIEQMGHLNELLDQRNPQEVLRAFRDNPLLARTAIIKKGDNLSHLDSLQEAADILLREKYGPDIHIGNIMASQIKEISQELGLPFTFWASISESAFHKNDEKLFRHLTKECRSAFADNLPMQNILDHDQASWIGSREKNPLKAGEINKRILNESKEQEIDPSLKQKILFGIQVFKFQSGKRFEEAPDKMIKIAEEMKRLNMPEASRAYEEAAKMALELGKLDQAEEYLKQGVEIAAKSHYPNAILSIEKTWAEVLKARRDFQGTRKYSLDAIETSRKLGGHYKEETLPEIKAELRDQFPCRILIEVKSQNGFLVLSTKEGFSLPEISLKIPEEKRKLPQKDATESVATDQVEEIIFEEVHQKGKKSRLAGRKYQEIKRVKRDLGKDLTQQVQLSQLTLPQNIEIFQRNLTRLEEKGYIFMSRDDLVAQMDSFDKESQELISSLVK